MGQIDYMNCINNNYEHENISRHEIDNDIKDNELKNINVVYPKLELNEKEKCPAKKNYEDNIKLPTNYYNDNENHRKNSGNNCDKIN